MYGNIVRSVLQPPFRCRTRRALPALSQRTGYWGFQKYPVMCGLTTTREDGQALLQGRPAGTFLLRLSSRQGSLAVMYVRPDQQASQLMGAYCVLVGSVGVSCVASWVFWSLRNDCLLHGYHRYYSFQKLLVRKCCQRLRNIAVILCNGNAANDKRFRNLVGNFCDGMPPSTHPLFSSAGVHSGRQQLFS